MASLTRGEMEQVIRSGGSVLYGGRILTKVEHLPAAEQLAGDDPARLADAAAELDAQIAALQARRAALGSEPAPTTAAAPPPDSTSGDTSDDLAELGLSAEVTERLRAAGLTTQQQVRDADDATLLGIDGIGDATLKKIRG